MAVDDVILAVGGRDIRGPVQLTSLLGLSGASEPVELTIRRGESIIELRVELDAMEARPDPESDPP